MSALSPYRPVFSTAPSVACFSLPGLPTCTAPWGQAQTQAYHSCHLHPHHHHHQPFAHIDLETVSLKGIVDTPCASTASVSFLATCPASRVALPGSPTLPTRRGRHSIRSKTHQPSASSGAEPPQLDIPSQGSESPEPVRSNGESLCRCQRQHAAVLLGLRQREHFMGRLGEL